MNRASTTGGPLFRRTNCHPSFAYARAKVTSSPSTRTDIDPPSVSITLVYPFGAGAVVVVVVDGTGCVVVVVDGAAVGWVVVGETALGFAAGVGAADDADPSWPDDLAGSSLLSWALRDTACTVVVVCAVVVVCSVVVVASTAGPVARVVSGGVRVERVVCSMPESPSAEDGSSLDVGALIPDAEIPNAVGTPVTSLRALLTAAVAMVTATTVATNHARPIPPNFLILVVWCRFSDSEIIDR